MMLIDLKIESNYVAAAINLQKLFFFFIKIRKFVYKNSNSIRYLESL